MSVPHSKLAEQLAVPMSHPAGASRLGDAGSFKQLATVIVRGDCAHGGSRDSHGRGTTVTRASPHEKELQIQPERRWSIVKRCLEAATIGSFDVDAAYFGGDDTLDPYVVLRSLLVRATGDEVLTT